MTRKPCPSRKRGSYADFGMAAAAALRVSRHLGPIRCYHCPDCGRWHLTRIARWIER